MSDTATLDNELNQAILAGDILGAFDKYYADDVVMQENSSDPFVGKELNRKREEEFVAKVEAIHDGKVIGSAINGDRTYSEWMIDVTFKGGFRTKLEQVASRLWKDGKVVHERFYYKG